MLQKRLAENEPLNSVDLFITEKCNLKCLYCFHTQSPLTLDFKTGTEILNILHEISPENMNINFFGGEPLLYPILVLDLANYAKKLWKDKKIGFTVSTNGTYFNKEIFTQFKELNFKIQVSIDGDRETTELYRQGIDFDVVINNIQEILKLFPDMSIRMTYTPDTVGKLAQNIQFIYELGVQRIMHHAVMEANWSEETINQYAYQLKQIYSYRRFLKNNGRFIDITFIDKNLGIVNEEIKFEAKYCGAGKDYLAILPNGDVYPCHRAASKKIFKLGNLFDQTMPIIRGMFLSIDKIKTGCAHNCWAFKTCHTCIITHYLVNQNISVPITKYCEICKIENQLAKDYLQTELNDKYKRKLDTLGLVLADISEQQLTFQTKTLDILEKIFILIKTEKEYDYSTKN